GVKAVLAFAAWLSFPAWDIPRKAGSSPCPARLTPPGHRIIFLLLHNRLARANNGLPHFLPREEQIPFCRLSSGSARGRPPLKGSSGLMRAKTTGICLKRVDLSQRLVIK